VVKAVQQLEVHVPVNWRCALYTVGFQLGLHILSARMRAGVVYMFVPGKSLLPHPTVGKDVVFSRIQSLAILLLVGDHVGTLHGEHVRRPVGRDFK
jgi:hypothetical protein